jgi:hypothetical protein
MFERGVAHHDQEHKRSDGNSNRFEL